jgi:multiple sugar transport system permease protein
MAARTYSPPWRRGIGYAVLILFGLVFIGPFLIQLATSFKTDADAANNSLSLVPHPVSLAAWKRIFGFTANAGIPFGRWLTNSIIVATFITLGRVFLDSLAGYALARLRFPGRQAVFWGILGILAVPGAVLLIPRFLVLKELTLFNTYPGMILPIVVDAAGIFLMRQFFVGIPTTMEEAARIDGAGVFRTYWSVILPMARPGLITLTILSFQGSWNEFQLFLVAASDRSTTRSPSGWPSSPAASSARARSIRSRSGRRCCPRSRWPSCSSPSSATSWAASWPPR